MRLLVVQGPPSGWQVWPVSVDATGLTKADVAMSAVRQVASEGERGRFLVFQLSDGVEVSGQPRPPVPQDADVQVIP